jgi:hypothetical protein
MACSPQMQRQAPHPESNWLSKNFAGFSPSFAEE